MSIIAIVGLILQRPTKNPPVASANGFYELRKEGKCKVPMWVHLRNRQPFVLAGLWDVWRKPDGKKLPGTFDEKSNRFVSSNERSNHHCYISNKKGNRGI
jgi:hypothetical protein